MQCSAAANCSLLVMIDVYDQCNEQGILTNKHWPFKISKSSCIFFTKEQTTLEKCSLNPGKNKNDNEKVV